MIKKKYTCTKISLIWIWICAFSCLALVGQVSLMGNYNRHLRVCAHAAAAKQTPFNRAHQMNISFALYLRAMFCRSSKERPAGTTKPGPLVNSVPYGNPLLIFGICLASLAPIFCSIFCHQFRGNCAFCTSAKFPNFCNLQNMTFIKHILMILNLGSQ